MKLNLEIDTYNKVPYREFVLLPTLVYRDNYYLTKKFDEENYCNYKQSLILRWLHFFILVNLTWETNG